MITGAMDEKRAKDRMLESLTWKNESIKGGHPGSQEGIAEGRRRARKNDIIKSRCHEATMGDRQKRAHQIVFLCSGAWLPVTHMYGTGFI